MPSSRVRSSCGTRRRRMTATPRPTRLSTASTPNSAIGCHARNQREIVATAVSSPRLNAMDTPRPDQAAMRGQLLTMARPGTRKVKTRARSKRSAPTLSRKTTSRSIAATNPASRSMTSSRRAVDGSLRRILLDISLILGKAYLACTYYEVTREI